MVVSGRAFDPVVTINVVASGRLASGLRRYYSHSSLHTAAAAAAVNNENR